jgi:hypothetical protein
MPRVPTSLRIAAVGLVVTIGGAVWWSLAGAEPRTPREPGLVEAQAILDCGANEGAFTYHAEWTEGSGFPSARDALDALLEGADVGWRPEDFQATEIPLLPDGAVGTRFVAGRGEQQRVVVWAIPHGETWLAGSIYGCARADA